MAAISEVTICNHALSDIGATEIVALTDDSRNARVCNLRYELIRDFILCAHAWNFAQKRFVLATVDEDPVWTEDGVTIVYQIPVDCLKINFVNIPSSLYKIESDKILSNTSGLKIKYTTRVTDPNLFFPLFAEALIAKLAAEIAFPITKSRTLAEQLFKVYHDVKLPEAISEDSQQGTPEVVHQSEWLLSRQIGSGDLYGQTGWNTWYPV